MGNCGTGLFRPNDFNVWTTIFERNERFYTLIAYVAAWVETIRDSLGGAIVNSDTQQSFVITKEGQRNGYLYHGSGKDLIARIRSKYQKPCSLRIDMLGEKTRSWVIIVP